MVAQATALTTITGIVGARNERGLRLRGEDEWRNLSKFVTPAPIIPAVGLPVRLGLDRSGFVRQVETIEPAQPERRAEVPHVSPDVETASTPPDRERQIVRMNALGHAVALCTAGGVPANVADILEVAAELVGGHCRMAGYGKRLRYWAA